MKPEASGRLGPRHFASSLVPAFLSTVLVNGSPAFPTNNNTHLQLAALGSEVETSSPSVQSWPSKGACICVSLEFFIRLMINLGPFSAIAIPYLLCFAGVLGPRVLTPVLLVARFVCAPSRNGGRSDVHVP